LIGSKTGLRMKMIFGPVASRRLGLSLGVDLVPHKTCDFDCVYCECGRTTDFVTVPGLFNRAEPILAELREVLESQGDRLDFVTLSGAGEPTLNRELGKIVAGIKSLTKARIAAITNSTLLHRPEVMEALEPVDVLMPSLDSAIEKTYLRINRPDPSVTLEKVLEGLYSLRTNFQGRVWLEILLVAGLNDGPEEIEALRREALKIDPDRIQLNTVDRPPADRGIEPVAFDRLKELALEFGPRAEVIASPKRTFIPGRAETLEADLLAMIDRRPCTEQDLITAFGLTGDEFRPILKTLLVKGRVRQERLNDKVFLRGVIRKG